MLRVQSRSHYARLGVKLLILLIFAITSVGCYGKPVTPQLTLTGEKLFGDRIKSEGAQLTITWGRYSETIKWEEIRDTFLLLEGNFSLNKNVVSTDSGLPVLDYFCHCPDIEPHRIYISVNRNSTKMVVQLKDTLLGDALEDDDKVIVKKIKGVTGQDAVVKHQRDFEYELNEGVISHIDGNVFDLKKIIEGGEWRKVNGIVYDDYDAVIQWQCTINHHAGKMCHCGLEPDLTGESELPWDCEDDYKRRANLAFKIDEKANVINVIIFESNFKSDEKQYFPQDRVNPGALLSYPLVPER